MCEPLKLPPPYVIISLIWGSGETTVETGETVVRSWRLKEGLPVTRTGCESLIVPVGLLPFTEATWPPRVWVTSHTSSHADP